MEICRFPLHELQHIGMSEPGFLRLKDEQDYRKLKLKKNSNVRKLLLERSIKENERRE